MYENLYKSPIIIRFLFTVVSWLPVPLVKQVTGPRATTVNMIRTIPGLGHIFVYNDSHLSFDQQYVLTVESLSSLISLLYLD